MPVSKWRIRPIDSLINLRDALEELAILKLLFSRLRFVKIDTTIYIENSVARYIKTEIPATEIKPKKINIIIKRPATSSEQVRRATTKKFI